MLFILSFYSITQLAYSMWRNTFQFVTLNLFSLNLFSYIYVSTKVLHVQVLSTFLHPLLRRVTGAHLINKKTLQFLITVHDMYSQCCKEAIMHMQLGMYQQYVLSGSVKVTQNLFFHPYLGFCIVYNFLMGQLVCPWMPSPPNGETVCNPFAMTYPIQLDQQYRQNMVEYVQ